MARLFDDAQNEYFYGTPSPVTAYPYVLGAWCRTDDDGLNNSQTILQLADKDVGDNYDGIFLTDGVNGGILKRAQIITIDGGGALPIFTSNSWAVNQWVYVCGLFIAANDRRVLMNNAGKDTSATNKDVAAALDRVGVGATADSTRAGYFSGRIAWPAIWDLTNWPGATASDKGDEFERVAIPSLVAGWSPLAFPLGLVALWPLGGFDTGEADGGTAQDIVGGYDMTAFSDATGPGIADHPGGLIYPVGSLAGPVTAAPAVGNPWYYYAQQELVA